MIAYRNGDGRAFEVLYGRWRGPVYRYFRRQCSHSGVADELFQDVFLRVIGAAAGYAQTGKFSTWLFRIAHNRLVDHWRRIGREPVDPLPPEDDGNELAAPAPENCAPDREAERGELRQALISAVKELPDVQREAFLLAEEGALTLEEIAAISGVGRETVKSRLRYATNKLRSKLGAWR